MNSNLFLENKTELFELFLNNTNDMLFILHLDGLKVKILYVNDITVNKLGYSLKEMNEMGIENFRKPLELSKPFLEHIRELKIDGNKIDYSLLLCKDKTQLPVEVNATIIEHNNIIYNMAVVRDISDRFKHEIELENEIKSKTKELSENLHKLQSYKDAMDINSIVTISNPSGIIKYANDKFYEVSKYTPQEVIGKNHNIVRHPDVPAEVFADMWATIKSKKVWYGELKNLSKDGKTYIVKIAIVPILDADDNIIEYIATRYEITDIINKQTKIEKLARTDALTGLYNRFYLNERLKIEQNVSIALIDINRFHEINDFYGDKVGDNVIIALSKILKSKFKSRYFLYHLSGDEFIILNRNISREFFINDMIEVNSYLNSQTLKVNEKSFYISTTISLSFDDNNNLLSSVHLAQTYAKQNGLNFNIYSLDNPLEKEYKENLSWANKIKKAILDDRIILYYQPLVDTKTQKIIKYEALVRMVGINGEIISPFFFLDKAKQSNQYTQITQIVVDKAFSMISANKIDCSINLTIEDIQSTEIKEYIYDKLNNFDLCENITFEVVESEGIENFEEVTEFIKTIKSYGCTIAIDDFGTGYSNFEYLLKLNADIIKIDGSLIKEIDKNQDHYDIVKTIVSFAKIKNLKVVAEYVSSKSIYEKIKELDIDYSQGYYFSEPKAMEI